MQAPLTLITAFSRLASSSTFGKSAPWLRRGRGRARLQDGEMVDNETRVRVAVDHGRADIDLLQHSMLTGKGACQLVRFAKCNLG